MVVLTYSFTGRIPGMRHPFHETVYTIHRYPACPDFPYHFRLHLSFFQKSGTRCVKPCMPLEKPPDKYHIFISSYSLLFL